MSAIAFISTMYGETWGGSEQLWGAAAHALLAKGHRVEAGVNDWEGPRPEWDALEKAGCKIHIREYIPRLPVRLLNRFLPAGRRIGPWNADYKWLRDLRPDLVMVCQNTTENGLELMELCVKEGWRYATVVQWASEYSWPEDSRAARLRAVYQNAAAAFFVSSHNLRLTEKQIAASIPRGEIVWNSFRAPYQQPLAWPDESRGFRLACVGRLQPQSKGQDILLRVLSQPKWQQREVRVHFFGKGINRRSLGELAGLLGVRNVEFGGFVQGVSGIWENCHALVLASRSEGLPIVLVEASLSGRPAICTAVAGVPEVIEDGVTGFLARAAEVDLLDAALECAWQKRGEWREMGLRAAQRVRGLFPEKPEEHFARRCLELASTPMPGRDGTPSA
ncbi:MAG: glycosyltransferase family 4 protein [Limisphaerales bacterium]